MSEPSTPATELPPITVRAKFFFEGDAPWFLRGVTYGPFRPNADGDFMSTPEQARRDFALMREMGINLIRVYHVPARWLLDLAAEHGLRVLVSIPWTQHVEFLNSRSLIRQIKKVVREMRSCFTSIRIPAMAQPKRHPVAMTKPVMRRT